MKLIQVNLADKTQKELEIKDHPTMAMQIAACNSLNKSCLVYSCVYYVLSVEPKPSLKLKVGHQQILIDALNRRTIQWNCNHTDKRNRWDAMWSVQKLFGTLYDEIYKYANDDHIDSFLRHYFNY